MDTERVEDFKQRVFSEITRRTAERIRAAHQRGDDLRKAVEFTEKEVNDGAALRQAIQSTWEIFPDMELQQELAEILGVCKG